MKKLLFWILFVPGCLIITGLILFEMLGELSKLIEIKIDKFEYWCFDRKYNK